MKLGGVGKVRELMAGMHVTHYNHTRPVIVYFLFNSSLEEENQMHETKANMQVCRYHQASSSTLPSLVRIHITLFYKKENRYKMQNK